MLKLFAAICVLGLVLVGLAPLLGTTAWMMPLGYFTALVGAAGAGIAWVITRSRG